MIGASISNNSIQSDGPFNLHEWRHLLGVNDLDFMSLGQAWYVSWIDHASACWGSNAELKSSFMRGLVFSNALALAVPWDNSYFQLYSSECLALRELGTRVTAGFCPN